VISPQLVPDKGWLEDVVVLTTRQGRGIGRQLTQRVIAYARSRQIAKLDLTSSNNRQGAHHLYEGLGWVDRDSRLMRLDPTAIPAGLNGVILLIAPGSHDASGSTTLLEVLMCSTWHIFQIRKIIPTPSLKLTITQHVPFSAYVIYGLK
jgi:predicted GNAT family acetyltransferase